MEQRQFFNKLAPNWDKTRNSNHELLAKLVAKLQLKPEDNVLDLGSGTGVLLPYLAPRAAWITAVDFAEEMLKISSQKNKAYRNITYMAEDVVELPFAPETFQQITCLNFFPHVEDKQIFLENMYRLLKPGGRVTIMHDISRAAVNHIHGSCEQVQEDKLMSAAALNEILTKLGYTVIVSDDTENYYFVQGIKL